MSRIFRLKRAASANQYALVLGLIVVIALLAITQLGLSVKSLFLGVSNRLNGTSNTAQAVSQPPPATPDPFAFVDQPGIALGAVVESNAVNLGSFTGTLSATCTGCTAIARNGAFTVGTSLGGFVAGDTIALRQTASSTPNTATFASVTVGTITSSPWTVTSFSGGYLMGWGYNNDYELAAGNNTNKTSPVDVLGISSGVTGIAAGGFHSCALVNGGVKCWGYNGDGQVGITAGAAVQTPVDAAGLTSGVTQLSAGVYHNCAVQSGSAVCWGQGAGYRLGNNSTANSFTAVTPTGLSSNITMVSAGRDHGCALNSSGGVKCWGTGSDGQIGNGGTANAPTPVDVTGITSGASFIAAGSLHSCAIINGGLKCWGNNDFGQSGAVAPTDQLSPFAVYASSSGVTHVSASTSSVTCAVVNGAARCWGYNGLGQLGNNSTTSTQSPQQVTGLTSGVVYVASGDSHSCARLSDGTARCWGADTYGQIGDGGSATSSNVPVVVTGLTGVSLMSVGISHTLILR